MWASIDAHQKVAAMLQKRRSEDKSENVMKVKIKKRFLARFVALISGFTLAGMVYATSIALTGKNFETLDLLGFLGLFVGAFIPFFVQTAWDYWKLRRVWETLPDAAQRLGDFNQRIREKAFEELMQQGNNAVPIFMQVLETPARENELWDGRAANLMAIGGLAKLKSKGATPKLMQILKEAESTDDGLLRLQVIQALGEIGDSVAVPALIPFIGDQFAADEALQKLGEGELVDAFSRVLNARDEVALRKLMACPYQSELAKAFSHHLLNEVYKRYSFAQRLFERRMERKREGWFVKAKDKVEAKFQHSLRDVANKAANSAWALGELGLVEGLPALEKAAKRIIGSLRGQRELMETDYVLSSCIKAIAKLRLLATLPRPASATDIDTSVLPRPATSTQALSTENLPAIPQTDENLKIENEAK